MVSTYTDDAIDVFIVLLAWNPHKVLSAGASWTKVVLTWCYSSIPPPSLPLLWRDSKLRTCLAAFINLYLKSNNLSKNQSWAETNITYTIIRRIEVRLHFFWLPQPVRPESKKNVDARDPDSMAKYMHYMHSLQNRTLCHWDIELTNTLC